MEKNFKNLNEEINRIKSLFTEERLYGNLMEQKENEPTCTNGDCKNGEGTLLHKNGDKYVGNFKDGKYDGQGTYTYKGYNEEYVGTWSDGKILNGKGTYRDKLGTTYVGTFKNGKLNGEGGYMSHTNGKPGWKGNFKNGVLDGKGTEFNLGGTRLYTGEFKDGVRNGKGTSFDGEGKKKYVGTWVNGEINGEGTLYEDGKIFKTKHENGEELERVKVKEEETDKKSKSGDGSSEEKENNKSGDGSSGGKVETNKETNSGDNSKEKEEDVLSVREQKCNNRIDKYLKRFEKNTSFLNDIIKNKDEDNSEYKIIEYCITKFGSNYTGNPNLNRFLDKLGIVKPSEEIDINKTKFNIVIDNKKVATLRRLKTYEYVLYGEENYRLIQNGRFANPKLKYEIYEVLTKIESSETPESLDKKIEIINLDNKYPQSITFKINP